MDAEGTEGLRWNLGTLGIGDLVPCLSRHCFRPWEYARDQPFIQHNADGHATGGVTCH